MISLTLTDETSLSRTYLYTARKSCHVRCSLSSASFSSGVMASSPSHPSVSFDRILRIVSALSCIERVRDSLLILQRLQERKHQSLLLAQHHILRQLTVEVYC